MSNFKNLVSILHDGTNPYKDFCWSEDELDSQGWNSKHAWFATFFVELQPNIVIEVGSWKGGSARHMAACAKTLGIDTAIVCVDTWLAEDVLWNSPEWRSSLKMKHGRPTVYQTFMANTVAAGHHDRIVPLSMPSLPASRYLLSRGVMADFIYIDGDHSFEGALSDFREYWKLLRPGGVMLIDDYLPRHDTDMFVGLCNAVLTFAAEKNLSITAMDEKCYFRKPV